MRAYRLKQLLLKSTKLKWLRAVKRFVIVSTIAFLLFLFLNALFPLRDNV